VSTENPTHHYNARLRTQDLDPLSLFGGSLAGTAGASWQAKCVFPLTELYANG
jgi:hypothetical protein